MRDFSCFVAYWIESLGGKSRPYMAARQKQPVPPFGYPAGTARIHKLCDLHRRK